MHKIILCVMANFLIITFLNTQGYSSQCQNQNITIIFEELYNYGDECEAEAILNFIIRYTNYEGLSRSVSGTWGDEAKRNISTLTGCKNINLKGPNNRITVAGICVNKPISVEVWMLEKDGDFHLAAVLEDTLWIRGDGSKYVHCADRSRCIKLDKHNKGDYCDQSFSMKYSWRVSQ